MRGHVSRYRQLERLESRALLAVDLLGPGSTGSSAFTEVNGELFFVRYEDELWKTDGTSAGTMLLIDIYPGGEFDEYGFDPNTAEPRGLTNLNGTLVFSATDGDYGYELWKSDGTLAGTTLLKDISEVPPGQYDAGSGPRGLTNVNGTLFFTAYRAAEGFELWRSDGTAAGTTLVKDIEPGAGQSYPRNLVDLGGTLFFSAATSAEGRELWKSDGTAAGTVLVEDIRSGSLGSDPETPTDLQGTLFFVAHDGVHGDELWKSDGTPEGTTLVRDIHPSQGSSPKSLAVIHDTLYFSADDGQHGRELWKTHGTQASTSLVANIDSGLASSFTRFNNAILFQASGSLWRTNGTAAGTRLVKAFGSDRYDIGELTSFGSTLFFRADDGIHGSELWQSDGTAAGTNLIRDIEPGSSGSYPSDFLLHHGRLIFSTGDLYSLGINRAPVLTTANQPALSSIKEDNANPAGDLVSSLLANALTDADSNDPSGIAVVGASTYHGSWQFQLSGNGTWKSIGAATDMAALLLPAEARVRFVPKSNFNGWVFFYYRAWDQSMGRVGAPFNLVGKTGGTKAFSVATESASLRVKPINDRPVLSVGGTIGYVHDRPAVPLSASAMLIDVDSINFPGGQLKCRVTIGVSTVNRLEIGGGFTVKANNDVVYGANIIGQLVSNGVGTNALIVRFNGAAWKPIVHQLLRAISFKTVGGVGGTRVVSFSLSDGDGGSSVEVTKNVYVT